MLPSTTRISINRFSAIVNRIIRSMIIEEYFDISFSFLDNIDRISAQNFTPTDDDILRVRIPTTGIVQEEFEFSHVQLR